VFFVWECGIIGKSSSGVVLMILRPSRRYFSIPPFVSNTTGLFESWMFEKKSRDYSSRHGARACSWIFAGITSQNLD